MFDLILVVDAILSIIKKTSRFAKGFRARIRKPSERKIQEAKSLLEDISSLIEKFSESVDIILETLETVYPNRAVISDRYRLNISTAKLVQANRRLFELSSEMRVIVPSISKRLGRKEASQIKKILDYCLQIINIEDFIGVALAKKFQFDKLPIKPVILGHEWYLEMESLPSVSPDEYVIYFNRLLLKLIECKEKLAITLQKLS